MVCIFGSIGAIERVPLLNAQFNRGLVAGLTTILMLAVGCAPASDQAFSCETKWAVETEADIRALFEGEDGLLGIPDASFRPSRAGVYTRSREHIIYGPNASDAASCSITSLAVVSVDESGFPSGELEDLLASAETPGAEGE